MESLVVTYSVKEAGQLNINFTVALSNKNIEILSLFAVNLWDFDGFSADPVPAGFKHYQNPNSVEYGDEDIYKVSWQALSNTPNNQSVMSGFNAVVPSVVTLGSIPWFADVIVSGVTQRVEGFATAQVPASPPKPPVTLAAHV